MGEQRWQKTRVLRPSIACSPMAACVFQPAKSRVVPLGREEVLLPVSQALFSPKCGSRRFPVVQSTLPLDRALCFPHSKNTVGKRARGKGYSHDNACHTRSH